ncbi:hypothetical protein F4802DRAFT_12674 [Xylaria palmicola]|nr:hypothetical protein F4802DRAFT_12674 [Xylaria palmicola]
MYDELGFVSQDQIRHPPGPSQPWLLLGMGGNIYLLSASYSFAYVTRRTRSRPLLHPLSSTSRCISGHPHSHLSNPTDRRQVYPIANPRACLTLYDPISLAPRPAYKTILYHVLKIAWICLPSSETSSYNTAELPPSWQIPAATPGCLVI